MLFIAELEKKIIELQQNTSTEPTTHPPIHLVLPIILAGMRLKKCVASMFFEWNGERCGRLSLSGWANRGAIFTRTFVTPKIDEAIKLAEDIGCCHSHQFDQGKVGRFFASHAERQLLVDWWEHTEGKGKVFRCDTAIVVCDDCKQFFSKIGAHLGIQVWINDKRY